MGVPRVYRGYMPLNRSPLAQYKQKRDFKKTGEPVGKEKNGSRAKDLHRFVVQRHAASTLHYDFRLEMNGVLKSWAVLKKPMMNPSVRRLAVQVEDHPIEYVKFEGDIPAGQYGAGHVDIWDAGNWTALDRDPAKAYKNGKISFELNGLKLKGRWTLVRAKLQSGTAVGKNKVKSKSWLLIKSRDEFTGKVLHRRKTKAKKGQRAIAARHMPEPQLAVLVDHLPQGEDWFFEQKYDGCRILTHLEGGNAKMYSRNRSNWSNKFSALIKSLTGISTSAVLDGEVIALNAKGLSDIHSLQTAIESHHENLRYVIFDLLEEDGADLRHLPLTERRMRLSIFVDRYLSQQFNIEISKNLGTDGKKLFAQACRKRWEGLIAKRAQSVYRVGRSQDWLKIKCPRARKSNSAPHLVR
jgi:bifunctional non-homologous end joining protein LigD